MCEVLIALGARVTDANKLGQNAIDTSEFNGHVALRQAAPPLPTPPEPSLFLSSSVLSSSLLVPASFLRRPQQNPPRVRASRHDEEEVVGPHVLSLLTSSRYTASADLHEPPTSQQQLDDYLRRLEHEELLEEERSKRRTLSKNQGLGVSTSRPRCSTTSRRMSVTKGRKEEEQGEDQEEEEGPEDLPPWFR